VERIVDALLVVVRRRKNTEDSGATGGGGRADSEWFRLLVEGVQDYAILGLDPTGHVTSWNVGAELIKGYRADEILGRHYSVFYPPEEVAAGTPQRLLDAAAANGRAAASGWRVRKDGSRFWATVVITALHDDQGRYKGLRKSRAM
jgi:PAS domain S-box-containing protein